MEVNTKNTNASTGYHLKAKRTLALYNMIPNLVWSVINLVPITIYYIHLPSQTMLYLFLIFSLIPIFLPIKIVDKIQLSSSAKIYKRLGVHLVSKVSQNGEIINRLVKRKYPDHKIVAFNKRSIAGLISQTYMFEKFHLCAFHFFYFNKRACLD